MFSNLNQNKQENSMFSQPSVLPAFSNFGPSTNQSKNSINFNFAHPKPLFESQIGSSIAFTSNQNSNIAFGANKEEVEQQETTLDPYIQEIERKQKLLQEAKTNKKLREEIIKQEDVLRDNPKVKKIDEAINKVISQTDQFIALIQCKEENYMFPKRIETIQAEIQKISNGIKYGSNTSQFQKTLSDLGYLCWETSNKLEQVEIEMRRIQKHINENDQKFKKSSLSAISKNQVDSNLQNKKRLEDLDVKLNHLKCIFDEFNKNINYINNSKEVNEKKNLEKMMSNISLIQQDVFTQCFQTQTLNSKIQDKNNSEIQLFLNESIDVKLQVLENMIVSRFKELHEKVIQLDIQLIDNQQKQKQVKGRVDLDFDSIDLDTDQVQNHQQNQSEYHLLHYSYVKSQQEKESNPTQQQNRIQNIKLAGRITTAELADENLSQKKSVTQKKQKKEIEFDLDDNFSSDPEYEELSQDQIEEIQVDSFQIQKNFIQCQSSIMHISAVGGGINFSQPLKDQIDDVQFKIQCDNSKVPIPHNIKFRQNLFKSLKSTKKLSKSQQDKEIYLGEHQYYQSNKLIIQNLLTPLQYEHLGKEAITKEKMKTIVNETQKIKNVTKEDSIINLREFGENKLPQKQKGDENLGRMVASIKEGLPSPRTEKVPPIMVKTKKANSFTVNESEILNPLDSDTSDDDSEYEQSVSALQVKKDNKHTLPANILGNRGVSINLHEIESQALKSNNNKQQQQEIPKQSNLLFQNVKKDNTSEQLQQQQNKNPPNMVAQNQFNLNSNQEKQTILNTSQQQKNPQTNPATTSLFENTQNNSTLFPQKEVKNQQQQKQQSNSTFPSFQPKQQQQPQLGISANPANKSQNENPKAQLASQPPSSPPQSQVEQSVSQGFFGQNKLLPKKQEDKSVSQQGSQLKEQNKQTQGLILNTQQKQNDQQKAQIASQPPSSPSQAQVTQQASQNLFGKGANETKQVGNVGDKQTTQQPPSTSLFQAKQQNPQGLFSQGTAGIQQQPQSKVQQQQQQQKASLPPDSPPQDQVKRQTYQEIFEVSAINLNKQSQQDTEKQGLFAKQQPQQQQQQKASMPPASPPQDQVKNQAQLEMFGVSTLNLNQQTQQITAQGAVPKLQQKPEAPPAAGENDKDKTLPLAPSSLNQQMGGLFSFSNKNSNNTQQQPQPENKLENKPLVAQQNNDGKTNYLFQTNNIGSSLFNQQQAQTDNKQTLETGIKQPSQILFSFSATSNTNNNNNSNNNNSIGMFGQKNNQIPAFNALSNVNQNQDKESGEIGIKKKRLSTEDKQNNQQTSGINQFNQLGFQNQNNQFSLNNINQVLQNQQNQNGMFNNQPQQQNNNNQQPSKLSAFNFGNSNSLNIQSGLFQGVSKSAAFGGNTNSLFGAQPANNSGNMFGFNQPAQQQGLPQSGFGTGNSSLFGQNTNNNQQNNQVFKQDLSKISFGFGQNQQQQQQQQQPNQPSGNMFSGFIQGQGSTSLFQTTGQQGNSMFGMQGNTSTPIINNSNNTTSFFNKPRK
ncbi:hypothetical protein ABPG72_015399 [Tetrahymena utriculariae]